MDARFGAFVALAALLIVIPGPDMALVTRNAVRHGRRAAGLTAYGVAIGSAGWGAASVLGVAVVLESSAVAFAALKLVGAAYLCLLGLLTLFGGGRDPAPAATRRGGPFLLQGALGNLLNPKAGVIFLTVFPQFIRPGDGAVRLLLMLAAYEVILVAWLNLYSLALLRGLRGRAGAYLKRASGLVLIGLGVRLASERA